MTRYLIAAAILYLIVAIGFFADGCSNAPPVSFVDGLQMFGWALAWPALLIATRTGR